MDLQLALLLSGIALIALVVMASLLPSTNFKFKDLLARFKKPERAAKSGLRDSSVAPRFDADDAALLGEEELIDEHDTFFDTPLTNDSQFDPRSIDAESFISSDDNQVTDEREVVTTETYAEEIAEQMQRPTFQEVMYDRDIQRQTIVAEQEVATDNDSLDDTDLNAVSAMEAELETESQYVASEQTKEQSYDSNDQTGPEMHITPTETFTSLRQIDYWVKLVCSSPHSLSEVQSEFTKFTDATHLNQQVHVLNQQDRQWHALELLSNDATFNELVISVQLLDNGQPISSSQLNAFVANVDALADDIGAQTQYLSPSAEAAIQSSNLASLYANCQGVIDASITSSDGQPLYGKLIESSAKMQGLDYLDGAYARIKQMGNRQIVLYRLVSSEGINFTDVLSSNLQLSAVKFVMNPATSEHPGRVVKEMLDAAKAFASRVNGDLNLIEGVEYHQDQLRQIRDQVSKIEAKMEKVGLPAGSAEALRLFS